jgi:HAD superfamily hydrolase (TIGR01509 family)
MATPLKALLWDVDGTLAETERDGHLVAFNAAFKELGLPWHWDDATYARLLRTTGGRERLLLDMANRADAPAEGAARERLAMALHQRKNAHYAHIVAQGQMAPRPGVLTLINEARLAGLQQAIVTTTTRANVDALLQMLSGAHWQGTFTVVVAAEDAPRKKPDPQAYRLALQRLGLAAHEAVAIEDSGNGVRAACNAGVPVLMARSQYFADDDASGALAVYESLAGLGLARVSDLHKGGTSGVAGGQN